MIHQRVSLITIGAWNVPLLRSFYKGLGWEESKGSSDNYAIFKTVGTILSIWSIDELSKDIELSKPDSPNYFRGVTLSINTDYREEVDEIISQVKEAGAKVIHEPNEAFWGGRTAGFLDPENNYWEVAYNPHSVFDERGVMIEMHG